MRVYLINPDYMLYANAPLGLACLAAYIRNKFKDIEVKILDQISDKKITSIIEKEKPEIVGLTSVSENWYQVKEMCKRIKSASPESKLVIGGVHVTTYPKCFERSGFDYGVLGEGEIPFSKIVESVKKNEPGLIEKARGIIFRKSGRIVNNGISEQIADLNELPRPAYDLLNMKYYTLPSLSSGLNKSFVIMTSRGCPYKCTFCSSSCLWERKIRFFSFDRVVEDIEFLYKKYGFNFIEIADDLFSINEDRLKKIIAGLREKNILGKIKFRCVARANNFTENIAKLLKEMGVYFIAFGFESGSDNELRYLKGESVNVDMNKRAIEICKKYGITPFGFFMIGSPYETIDDMKKTYEFIKENCRDNFAIYQTIAYPGTEVWEYATKNKIVREDIYENETGEFLSLNENLLTKEVSREDFDRIYDEIKSLWIQKNRKSIFKNIKLKNIGSLFNIIFFRKVWNLRSRFIKRIK